jgi:hypothetical protein
MGARVCLRDGSEGRGTCAVMDFALDNLGK